MLQAKKPKKKKLLHLQQKKVIRVVYRFGFPSGMIIDMDLQLGLALSSDLDKGFDLNCSEIEIKGEFEAIPLGHKECDLKKRNFLEAFEEKNVDAPRTLPLLMWGDRTMRGDDLRDDADSTSVISDNIERNDDNGVVGWPPINSWRKKICQVENGGSGLGGRNSKYVKVKMEGVGIARKVDISLHHSHHTLLQTLVAMFGKCHQSVQYYQLKYQADEGDWQSAEDVDWGRFIRSVHRLKLVRKRGYA